MKKTHLSKVLRCHATLTLGVKCGIIPCVWRVPIARSQLLSGSGGKLVTDCDRGIF